MGPGTILFCALLAGFAAGEEQSQSELDRESDIVVTEIRLRGAVVGTAEPVRRIDGEEVQSYGAKNVGELVDALGPQTRSNAGGPQRQIVLLNGNRIADFSEISGLPTEAIERIDILPEEVALSYGYPAGNRVLNIVLRERFRAAASENALALATEGGRSAIASDSTFARISGDVRINAGLSLAREGALFEAERDLIASASRTLLPGSRRFALDGTMSGALWPRVTGTLSGRLGGSDGDSRLGVNAAGDLIEREALTTQMRLAGTLSGDAGLWRWSAIASVDRLTSTFTDIEADVGGPLARTLRRTRFRNADATASLSASGPIARMAAGDLQASVAADVKFAGFTAAVAAPAAPDQRSRGRRDTLTLSGSLDVPLTAAGLSPGLGSSALNLSFTVRRLTDFGLQRTLGFAFRWSPDPMLSLSASYTDDDGEPTLQELGEPVLATPGVPLFDPARSETVAVTRLEGGNPALRANNRRERKIEAWLRPPWTPNLLLSANYSEVDLRNPIATFPLVSPALESAFPDRFRRDALGRLVLVDARALTVASSHFRGLRWGLLYSAQSPSRPSRRLQVSVYDTWRFTNTIRTSVTGPVLDLLDGSSTGIRGGLPRHLIEAQATFFTGFIGLRADATWQGATVVRARGRGTSDLNDLFYAPRGQISLRFFANLGQSPAAGSLPAWLSGGRLTVTVDNLLGSRPRVRDARGATPLALQAAFLEPAGRTVRISFRVPLL